MLICAAGFLFFSMLSCANVSIDYLLRTNIDNAVQSRAWGLISVISQLGQVIAYALSGILADYIFTPMLVWSRKQTASVNYEAAPRVEMKTTMKVNNVRLQTGTEYLNKDFVFR